MWIDVISRSNDGQFFTARECHFSPFVIISRVTWFECSKLCFEIYVCPICLFLCGLNKTLRSIGFLFVSKFLQFLVWTKICLSTSICLWSINSLLLSGDLFDLFMVYCNCYCILETVVIIIFWIYCCFSIFNAFGRIYLWSTTIEAYLIAIIMHSWKIIKNKVTALYRTFLPTICRWHKFMFHFQMYFSFTRFLISCIISHFIKGHLNRNSKNVIYLIVTNVKMNT